MLYEEVTPRDSLNEALNDSDKLEKMGKNLLKCDQTIRKIIEDVKNDRFKLLSPEGAKKKETGNRNAGTTVVKRVAKDLLDDVTELSEIIDEKLKSEEQEKNDRLATRPSMSGKRRAGR